MDTAIPVLITATRLGSLMSRVHMMVATLRAMGAAIKVGTTGTRGLVIITVIANIALPADYGFR